MVLNPMLNVVVCTLALCILALFGIIPKVAAQTPSASKSQPIQAQADTMLGSPEGSIQLRGQVKVEQTGMSLRAPEADYDALTDTLNARGGVVLTRGKDVLRTPSLLMQLGTLSGSAVTPEFFLAKNNARGNAQKLEMSEWRTQTFTDVNYTSCKPGQNDWVLKADTLLLDENTDTAHAKGAVLRFFDVPIFALPYFEFPMGKERRSGWLPPSAGINSISGFEVTAPYYLNLAHNYDAILNTRLMSKRGVQLSADSRYLGAEMNGSLRAEWLPKDSIKDDKRWGLFTHHQYTQGPFSAGLGFERVSDNTYFADLSRSASEAARTSLPGEWWARYQADWGTLSARVSKYQTLQDASNSIVPTYDRLPVVDLSLKPITWQGLQFNVQGQSTRFAHRTLVQGDRHYAVPQVHYDYKTDAGFIIPKLALNLAQYSNLNGGNYAGTGHFSRALPMASLDTGLVFERDTHWFGQRAQQTLEPRLYFLYVPFKDQANVPVFDSALSGFSFAQIFSDNVFSGQDRVADAKHVTPALTSRWISAQSGAELFKATLGKRYYFSPQRVQLSGPSLAVNPSATTTSSDWLLAAQGQLPMNFSVDAAMQYDQTNKEIVNSAYTIKYNPSQRRLISVSKRFTKNAQDAVDLSWQWRLGAGSAVVGRVAYSLGVPAANLAKGVSETLLGYEYDADCWTWRIAANRYNTTANTKATSIYLQLNFTGLSQLSSGSKDILNRNIPGYQPFDGKNTWTYDPYRPF